uniref:Protein MCM10 homolog n=1 Tax=Timema poppense TaxID=170557 RepID=A0A7R9DFM9_TIMPO|nr:unnamed protein product [Timema poppensis]
MRFELRRQGEVDIFSNSNNYPLSHNHNDSSQRTSAAKKILDEICCNTTNSIIHQGDTDSSDDEDNKYHEEQKYSNYGRHIKQLISKTNDWKATATGRDSYLPASRESLRKSTDHAKDPISVVAKKPDKGTFDVYADPLFGIRIVKPLISSLSLKDMAIGRTVVPMANIKRHLANGDLSADWVFGGVIVNKSDVKKSHKGAQYAIWKLSDLKGGLKTVSVFLFQKCFKEHWKTIVGTVVGILNPKPLDSREGSSDEAAVSVDNAQKIMIMGTSKDFGICKAKKKNGENCCSFVNVSQCEYCIYHLQQAYKNCSRRSEFQSPCSGRGLNQLRNKVLGKHEVFYAGQSYSAVPAKKNQKLTAKDDSRLRKLSDFFPKGAKVNSPVRAENKPVTIKAHTGRVELSVNQAQKDADRLRKLRATMVIPEQTEGVGFGIGWEGDCLANLFFPPVVPRQVRFGISRGGRKEERRREWGNEKQPEYYLVRGRDVRTRSCQSANLPDGEVKFNKRKLTIVSEKLALGAEPSGCHKTAATTMLGLAAPQLGRGLGSSGNVDLLPPRAKDVNRAKLNALKWIKTNGPIKKENPNKIPGSEKEKRKTMDDDMEKSIFQFELTGRTGHNWGRKQPTSWKGIVPTFTLTGSGNPFRKTPLHAPDWVLNLDFLVISSPVYCESTTLDHAVTKIAKTIQVFPNEKRPKLAVSGLESLSETSSPITVLSPRFKELLEATSKHTDLLEIRDNQAQEEYFDKLEKKERLEEKMLSTFKVPCKAVRCLKCKYTAFSASDRCKTEGHPLKVTNGTKRFFKCGDCGNRTVTLDIVPLLTCKNCSSSHWERAPMMREKKSLLTNTLSIRGGEETILGALHTDGNLNLLVPEN